MPKIDDRIQTLEAKLKQLKTRQQQIEARARSVATKRSRAEELRRKILVGAVVIAKVEAKEIDEAMLKDWLKPAISRPEDRAFFGLDGEARGNGIADVAGASPEA